MKEIKIDTKDLQKRFKIFCDHFIDGSELVYSSGSAFSFIKIVYLPLGLH
jgi:hypothetical protein